MLVPVITVVEYKKWYYDNSPNNVFPNELLFPKITLNDVF
jgi:hypothetical protein